MDLGNADIGGTWSHPAPMANPLSFIALLLKAMRRLRREGVATFLKRVADVLTTTMRRQANFSFDQKY
jgi:hypothetical protein